MRGALNSFREFFGIEQGAPALIAFGLAVLMASIWIPVLPVLTAMAVLALGATFATLVRFRDSTLRMTAIVFHAVTYAMLYALFVGAVFHSGTGSASQVGLLGVLDLALSWLVLTLAARQIAVELQRA